MPDVLKPQAVIEDIIASYEKRIEGLTALFDTTRLVLMDFQESAAQVNEEQSALSARLRDALAQNENLRKHDYDLMMRPIIEPRREQEKEVRALLNEFLADQQHMAADLKEHYAQIRRQLVKGDPKTILEQLNAIKELLNAQERKKEELTVSLRELQEEHQEVALMVKQLLVKGNALRIRDFKDILARIQNQHKERIARKLKRREEVRQLLAEFKQQRRDKLEEQRRPAAQMLGSAQWAALGQLQVLDQGADVQTKTA